MHSQPHQSVPLTMRTLLKQLYSYRLRITAMRLRAQNKPDIQYSAIRNPILEPGNI